MLKIIKKSNNPRYLVITPLKTGDKISKITKKTIKRNDIPFNWISYEAANNIPTNTQLALNKYNEDIRYIIKIDNDINASRNMLDIMYTTLVQSQKLNPNIAYCYPKFKYILKDGRQIDFSNNTFDVNKLLQSNYITSNSMIDRQLLYKVGNLVIDNQYERLLDWALWLRFLYYGYIGIPCSKSFETPLNDNNISARGEEDYKIRYERVYKDFVLPIKEQLS